MSIVRAIHVLLDYQFRVETVNRQPSNVAVLIIVENLPVPLDRRVWQESRALRDAGYDVAVICPKMAGYTAAEEVLEGIHIYRHGMPGEAGGFWGFFPEYFSALVGELVLAWKAWRRHRFKVIHLCNPPDLLFLVALPFRLFGVRVIYDVHDLWPEMYEAKFQKRGLFYRAVRCAQRLSYATATTVLATNESVRDASILAGKKSQEDIFVVRTSPEISLENVKENPDLKKNRPYLIGFIGVMGNADGVHYLVEAASHLVHRIGRKDVQFLLMGGGPEHARMREMRDRLRLNEFMDLPGRVSDEFLFTALRTMDIGVSCDPINPYNHHCTMNKVLEYMVFGKPQVMFDLKEGRVSAGDAAVYVEENSAVKLAEAIDSLLNDPARRKQMGQIGALRIQQELHWKRSVQNLLAAYERTLDHAVSADVSGARFTGERTNVPGVGTSAIHLEQPTTPVLDAAIRPSLTSVENPEVRSILGTPLDVTDYDRLGEFCRFLAAQPKPTAIEFANTQVVTMRRHERRFRQVTDRCFDHFVPDGMPLVWCMNRLGAGLEDRVYGPTFLRHFITQTPHPYKHFFLGGTEIAGQRLIEQIKAWNPGAHVSGRYHGICYGDGTLADESIIEQINELSPDFLWVGLGTPKQQAFVNRYRAQFQRGVILSVGFAFDVNAGTKRDAPLWMQRRGLTWLFRMATEPRRLARRYFRYNTLFLLYILQERLERNRE